MWFEGIGPFRTFGIVGSEGSESVSRVLLQALWILLCCVERVFYSRVFWLLTEILLTPLHQDLQGNHCISDTALGLSGVKNHRPAHPAIRKSQFGSLGRVFGVIYHLSGTGFLADVRCLPVFFLLLCIMESKTNIFGVLPRRDGILEVRSVTDPETLPCSFFLPGCQSVPGRVGGLEKFREVRRSGFSSGGTRPRA